MTGEKRLIDRLKQHVVCPICDGSGVDPVQRSNKNEEPAKCRRCNGATTICRWQEVPGGDDPGPEIILKEEVRTNGALVVHHQKFSVFVEKYREILEQEISQRTLKNWLLEAVEGGDPAMKDIIEGWVREKRL